MTSFSCCHGSGRRCAFGQRSWSNAANCPAGNGGNATLGCVAEWEKACTNMVLSGVRDNAVRSVRVEKGALRMRLWVRLLRGLGLVGVVLGGIVFGVAVGVGRDGRRRAVAQSAGSIVVEGNRRVEAETIRSYFRPGPGERLDAAKIDAGAQGALRHRPVPGRAHQRSPAAA